MQFYKGQNLLTNQNLMFLFFTMNGHSKRSRRSCTDRVHLWYFKPFMLSRLSLGCSMATSQILSRRLFMKWSKSLPSPLKLQYRKSITPWFRCHPRSVYNSLSNHPIVHSCRTMIHPRRMIVHHLIVRSLPTTVPLTSLNSSPTSHTSSIHPPIHPSSIHPPIHPSIHPSIHLSIRHYPLLCSIARLYVFRNPNAQG